MKKTIFARTASFALAFIACAALVSPLPAASSGLLQIEGYDCSAGGHPPVGVPITWTITASGGTGTVEYGFAAYWGTDIYDDTYTGSELIGIQPYGRSRSFTFTPDREGIYFVHGFARDDAGTVRRVVNRNAVFPPLQVLSISDVRYGYVGWPVRWIAHSEGGTGYEKRYQFIIYRDGVFCAASEDTRVPYDTREFSFTYVPAEPGSYIASVTVNANTEVDSMASSPVLVDPPLVAVSLIPDKYRTLLHGTVTWTATTTGGRDVEYRFRLYKDGEKLADTDYTSSNVFSAVLDERGGYTADCHITDHLDKVCMSSDVYAGDYMLMPLGLLGIFPDRELAGPGTEITWTVLARGGNGARTYDYELYLGETPAAFLAGVSENTFSFTLEESGTYRLRARVSDSSGSAEAEGGEVEIRPELRGMRMERDLETLLRELPTLPPADSSGVTAQPRTPTPRPSSRTTPPPTMVTPQPLSVKAKAGTAEASIGTEVKVQASASGGTGSYQYSFLLLKDGLALGDPTAYGPGNTWYFIPKKPGVYKVRVTVKDGENKASNSTGEITVR